MVAAVVDILGFGAVVAVCGGMYVIANRIEPHWVAKDKGRFLTTAQELDQFGLPMGRKVEVRVNLAPDEDSLLIRRRSMLKSGSGIWYVHAKSPKPPAGKEVYIVKKITGATEVNTMALRFPTSSTILARMNELLAATGEESRNRSRPPSGQPTYEDDSDPDESGAAASSE